VLNGVLEADVKCPCHSERETVGVLDMCLSSWCGMIDKGTVYWHPRHAPKQQCMPAVPPCVGWCPGDAV
jgi:hypothetical protein